MKASVDHIPAIEAGGLVKTYPGEVRALDGLDLSVPAGTIFALVGPNGAGKSTTVRMLTTLSRADAGTGRGAALAPRRGARPVLGRVRRLRGGRRAAHDRLRGPAVGRRPRGHGPREPAAA